MSADLDEFRPPAIKTQSDGDSIRCIGDRDSDIPVTPEHSKIPAILTCPPAPRKRRPSRRRVGGTCKRKLRVLDFFEIVAAEEIEEFFRTSEEKLGGGAAVKKRCVM
ncbi:uncharacterized protein LOC127241212 [Andrographis paniculata]|uniref:uncharacterized protein LOC127241212 n=1 Tax=Andrographis paniculata TaxID=175694 RepID=UPI0021E7EB15|nr:uncharacterized protein LOC127241212 [Andrographis paniculata]